MLPDAIRLTVSDVRQRIFEASGTATLGAGSVAGRIFHRAAGNAIRDGHPASWKSVLTSDLNAEEWAQTIYDRSLGPELTKSQSSLRENGPEVLTLWRGIQSFAVWFCGLLREAIQAGAVRYDSRQERWICADALFQTECNLSATWKEPGWAKAISINGRADHLIRLGNKRWCVVEFKLGGGHAESDAAQACLYHELLGGSGSAALARFGGQSEPSQTILEGEWIQEARPKLMALIAALAGVGERKTVETPTSEVRHNRPSAWPKAASDPEVDLGKRLIRALQEFHADARLAAEPIVGPTFVRFLLEPGRGIAASRIDRQGANLRVRLQLEQEPVIGRAGGRIAVDVQRPEREYVPFESVREALCAEQKEGGNSRVLAGVDLVGKVHFVDLARDAPHLLVGGIPGGGKSEWLRSAVASLLVTNSPDTLRVVLIDPKKNAFAALAQSPYLWRANSLMDTPDGHIFPLLEDLIDEMKRRYELFKRERADDLAHYAKKSAKVPPRLVCVVDEFADLLMAGTRADREAMEGGFIRIAQLGRAAGVHLILATQRPSRQVVSGVLKANVPGKVALRVANRVESSVLLDQGGAQNLLGKGDLLLSAGSYELIRLQSAYLSEEERQNVFGGVRGTPDER